MKNKLVKAGAAVLTLTLAAATPAVTIAAESSRGKEEVVYINTDASGNISEINVVNIWGAGNVTDYGDYSQVKMLTSSDEITQSGDRITFYTDEERVYYQGTMAGDTEIPWNIEIRYYMDGTEYTAEEIAGMSGELKITFKITENTECDTDFYDHYALQASFALDTEKCSNIAAEGATLADVGSDKQISYTILPGKGIDTEITAEVTDFEMDPVEINGVALNLNIEMDDEELLDKVAEITEAVSELNDGASELKVGADEINNGAGTLSEGTDTLNSGASSLESGAESLESGMETMKQGIDELNSQSQSLRNGSKDVLAAIETIDTALSAVSMNAEQLSALVSASGQIQTGIQNLYDGISTLEAQLGYAQFKALMAQNGVDVDSVLSGNASALVQLNNIDTTGFTAEQQVLLQTLISLLQGNSAIIGGMESYLNNVSAATTQLKNGAQTLNESYKAFNESINALASTLTNLSVNMASLQSAISSLLAGYEDMDQGVEAYTEGVSQIAAGYEVLLSGAQSLTAGSKELTVGSQELSSGARELYDGTAQLLEGTGELSEGTEEFYEETSGLDSQVEDKINEMIDSISGGDYELTSFVSEKNENVDAVQFVIKTSAIEVEEVEEPEEEEEEDTSFWQKLLDLFR